MTKISVIIPTYKPSGYLYECFNNLAKQSLANTLYEVIIVLNGPKSPYCEEIRSIVGQFPEVESKLIYLDKNGVSLARNKGLDEAKGEYIAFIDDDDLVSENYLESLLSISRPQSIMCSNVKSFIGDIDNPVADYLGKAFESIKQSNKNGIVYGRSFLSSACAKLIPKDIILNRRFDHSFRIGEDALFVAHISDRIKDIVLSSEDTLYYRRLREGSASRKKNDLIFELRNATKLIFEYLKIYFKSPFKYNPVFFATRILATIKFYIYRIT